MKTTYSRRELYALGEPFGDSATTRKLGGGYVCGGGGGGGFFGDFVSSLDDFVAPAVFIGAAVATGGIASTLTTAAEVGAAAVEAGAAASATAAEGAAAADAFIGGAAEATLGGSTAAELGGGAYLEAADAAVNTVLQQATQGVIRGAAISGGRDILTGNTDNLAEDMLIGGLSGGAGAGAGAFATQELGFNPIVSNAIQGGTSAGTSAALNGSNDITGAIEKGLVTGGAGTASSEIAKGMDLGPLATGAFKGAVQGGTGALLNNGDVATGILGGGASGAAGSIIDQQVTGLTPNKLLNSILSQGGKSLASSAINSTINGGLPTAPLKIAQSPSARNLIPQGSPSATAGLTSSIPWLDTSEGLLKNKITPTETPTTPQINQSKMQDIYANMQPELAAEMQSRFGGVPQVNLNPYNISGLPPVQSYSGGGTSATAGCVASCSYTYCYNQDAKYMPKFVSCGSDVLTTTPSSKRQQFTPKQLAQLQQHISTMGNMGGMASGGLPKKYRDVMPKNHNPEFVTGMTGYYACGGGTGQSDDIPAMLHDGD